MTSDKAHKSFVSKRYEAVLYNDLWSMKYEGFGLSNEQHVVLQP